MQEDMERLADAPLTSLPMPPVRMTHNGRAFHLTIGQLDIFTRQNAAWQARRLCRVENMIGCQGDAILGSLGLAHAADWLVVRPSHFEWNGACAEQ